MSCIACKSRRRRRTLCSRMFPEKHSILDRAARARADGSDPPDLRSHVQHGAKQRFQTRRMRASSVPCKCSWRVRSRSSGMPRRRWRVRACASTHLRRRLGFGENMSSSSQMNDMCSNSCLFRTLISSNPCWIKHLLLLCWPWPTLPDSSTPITESGLCRLCIENRVFITAGLIERRWPKVVSGKAICAMKQEVERLFVL
jgi:hypothetical protein